jgi:hypothetical protein
MHCAYDYTVLPGKDSYGVQLRDEIPPRSDVSCNEYAEGENGKWVHELRKSPIFRAIT